MNCYVNQADHLVDIIPIVKSQLEEFLQQQPSAMRSWASVSRFTAQSGEVCLCANANGALLTVWVGLADGEDYWAFGALPGKLPAGNYQIKSHLPRDILQLATLAWGMGSYQYTRYKKGKSYQAKLIWPHNIDQQFVTELLTGIYVVRDLINTPANDMGPQQFSDYAKDIAKEFHADFSEITGDKLLKHQLPLIHAVGKAGPQAPRLIEIKWGDKNQPKIALVGKGVCFDSGGLDIKTASGMLLMKKDMGGAAHVLALARLIMAMELPLQLHVIIPLVENSIDALAYRPGDVVPSRQGLTVEITNTDAEGRLVLADALTLACEAEPALIIDYATLTGAARVALGPEIPAYFSNNEELVAQLETAAKAARQYLWQLPLYGPYRDFLKSDIADVANADLSSHGGGAITAALFLEKFVGNIPWLHFDIMAYNATAKSGRPIGGEAMALRAVYALLKQRFNL